MQTIDWMNFIIETKHALSNKSNIRTSSIVQHTRTQVIISNLKYESRNENSNINIKNNYSNWNSNLNSPCKQPGTGQINCVQQKKYVVLLLLTKPKLAGWIHEELIRIEHNPIFFFGYWGRENHVCNGNT